MGMLARGSLGSPRKSCTVLLTTIIVGLGIVGITPNSCLGKYSMISMMTLTSAVL
jgi:hypothetical protein